MIDRYEPFSEHLVFIQGGAATPMELIRSMTEHGVCNNLRGVRLLHMSLEGDVPFVNPEFESTVFVIVILTDNKTDDNEYE